MDSNMIGLVIGQPNVELDLLAIAPDESKAQEIVGSILKVFSYRKQEKKSGNTYHQESLLVTKTSTLIEVSLDKNKHQKGTKTAERVFYALKDGNHWIVLWFYDGLWVEKLNNLVRLYQAEYFKTIDDQEFFDSVS
jgi:hypothetical protein